MVAIIDGTGYTATTWYVATNGNDSADGTNWGSAVLTISNAVAKSATNDTILVSNGTYKLNAPIVLPGATAAQQRFLLSLNGAEQTIIDGQGLCHCLTMNYGFVDGFTFSNGYYNLHSGRGGGGVFWPAYGGTIQNCVFTECETPYTGGGLWIRYWGSATGDDLIISNCTFQNNTGTTGGGAYVSYNRALMIDCRFVGNTATNDFGGGGMWLVSHINDTDATPMVMDCIYSNNIASHVGGLGGGLRISGAGLPAMIVSNSSFIGNSAYRGGGIYSTAERVRILNCTIFSNKADTAGTVCIGGGVYLEDADGLIDNCRITGNTSKHWGAGVYHYGGILRNSLIAGNTAITDGGGVYNARGIIRNCTIADNTAGTGGGVYLTAASGGVENSIVYFNTAAVSGSNWTHVAGYFTNTCTAPSVTAYGNGNITDDPGFADFAAGNYRLQSRSPCVNAGLNQDWMEGTLDLDGFPRIRQRIVDMGAFEGLRMGTLITVR